MAKGPIGGSSRQHKNYQMAEAAYFGNQGFAFSNEGINSLQPRKRKSSGLVCNARQLVSIGMIPRCTALIDMESSYHSIPLAFWSISDPVTIVVPFHCWSSTLLASLPLHNNCAACTCTYSTATIAAVHVTSSVHRSPDGDWAAYC